MSIIKIKVSQNTSSPPNLANGELAYSYSSNKLFLGKTDTANSSVSVNYIGGKLIVDKVANLELLFTGGSNISLANVEINNALKFTSGNYVSNGVLFANTSGVVNFVDGDSGSVMQVSDSGEPIFDELNGGTY
jgi:hypothetical protein